MVDIFLRCYISQDAENNLNSTTMADSYTVCHTHGRLPRIADKCYLLCKVNDNKSVHVTYYVKLGQHFSSSISKYYSFNIPSHAYCDRIIFQCYTFIQRTCYLIQEMYFESH